MIYLGGRGRAPQFAPEEVNLARRWRAHPTCVVGHQKRLIPGRFASISFPGCLVATLCHIGSHLNPSDEISQFGALGRDIIDFS